MSDRICKEHGLSVVKNPQRHKTARSVYFAEKNGEPTRYNLMRRALDEALRFTGEIDTALVATILDRVVVKKESTKDAIHLDIFLKLGSTYEAVYTPLKHTAGITSLKNTTHKPPTRRT